LPGVFQKFVHSDAHFYHVSPISSPPRGSEREIYGSFPCKIPFLLYRTNSEAELYDNLFFLIFY